MVVSRTWNREDPRSGSTAPVQLPRCLHANSITSTNLREVHVPGPVNPARDATERVDAPRPSSLVLRVHVPVNAASTRAGHWRRSAHLTPFFLRAPMHSYSGLTIQCREPRVDPRCRTKIL